jgi:hypothetical protein
MNYRLSSALAAAFLVLGAIIGTHMLAGAAVTSSPPAASSVTVTSGSVAVTSAPPVTGTVAVSTLPDVTIGASTRLDVNATTEPGTFLAVAADSSGTRLTMDVGNTPNVAVPGGVAITGVPTVALENGTIVNLGPTSLSTLTAATGKGACTYIAGNPTATVSTTAANIPASPLASRTAITIWNHSAGPTSVLICNPAGTATTTAGIRIESSHQWYKFEGLNSGSPVVVSCRCVTGTCTYNHLEEQCYQ